MREYIELTWLQTAFAAGESRGVCWMTLATSPEEQASLAVGLGCDPSQCIGRQSSKRKQLGTFTTSAMFYLFESDCVVCARHALAAQGFPTSRLSPGSFNQHGGQSLAGECWFFPHTAIVAGTHWSLDGDHWRSSVDKKPRT
jgi:hypothetical protein